MEASIEYAELLTQSNYSFLEGASFPEELVERAAQLEYGGIGLMDLGGVYGSPRAHLQAKKSPIPLLVGAQLPMENNGLAVLVARNRKGYGDLCELLTYYHCERDKDPLGWIQLPNWSSDLYLLTPSLQVDPLALPFLKDAFNDRLFLVAHRFRDGSDEPSVEKTRLLSRQWGIRPIASNWPLFHSPNRKPLQDVLRCIEHNCTLRQGGFRLLPNRERYLKTKKEMFHLFQDQPEWLENTMEIVEGCDFSLDEIRYRYPVEWIPDTETAESYLQKLVDAGAQTRYPNGVPAPVQKQLIYELELIGSLHYSDYFLTIWDIVQFARSKNILCQGRGSAANSTVCYVLGITSIDPLRMNLLFERFISRERDEPPDIDIDFEHERREEVIQYIYQRYGRHRAAITAEVICFRRKSALREVGKVFEVPIPVIEKIQKKTHREDVSQLSVDTLLEVAPHLDPLALRQYLFLVKSILSFPRHLGTHVGGFVLCQEALTRNVPVEKAAMVDRTIVQWDKNDLDALGFVRVDILGLGILTCIRKCLDQVAHFYGRSYTLASLPAEDPRIYDQLSDGDSVGVFQIESRAQMNMLPRLKPRNFYDLVVEIALVRPGPIQGDMVHPYLRRRQGKEPIEYPHPKLKTILQKTFGVPIFQEQIMKIAMEVAGFTGGQADELRRAMGIWRRDGKHHLREMGEKFRRGLIENGISEEFAGRIFSQIEGFAEYGFPESHSASFAILAYGSAYLRHYYPDAYVAAILNSQPMGFYSTHTLVHDAQRHGVRFCPVDVNRSQWDHHVEEGRVVRMGFREIRGLKERTGRAIEDARATEPFQSFSDFVERLAHALAPVPLSRRDLFLLAGANAMESLGLRRRDALWEIQGLLLKDDEDFAPSDGKSPLDRENPWEKVLWDFESQGVSLYAHPVQLLREELDQRGVTPSRELARCKGTGRIRVAGMVICRQMPPSASGVLFITLEDEWGMANLVIWNPVYLQYKDVFLGNSFLYCEGKIQKVERGKVVHILVDHAEPLLTQPTPTPRSHDWS